MASLFGDLLNRLGPKALASRLNITERTARNLRFASLSRFPRVTARAETLTSTIKFNTLSRAGVSIPERARHIGKSFANVTNIAGRFRLLVDAIATNQIEFAAERMNMSTDMFKVNFPEEWAKIRSGVRTGVSRSNKREAELEQDSV